MPNEIERKFRVKEIPSTLPKPLELTQTYLEAPQGEERRVRSINDEKFVMTIKRPKSSNGLVREEIEKEISKEDYELFLKSQIGTQIKKKRYKIHEDNDLTYELDVYEGKLKGLAVVEVEFTSKEDAAQFQAPEWFGDEVTSNIAYKNSSLALNGMPSDIIIKRNSSMIR